MHSSLISKIRILKPRKKAPQTPKSFTIKNLNFTTSSSLQSSKSEESPPPPLIHKNNLDDAVKETKNDQSQKWLPVYIVNVPKRGLVKVSKSDCDNVSKSGSSPNATCGNDELGLSSTFCEVDNRKTVPGHTFGYSNIEKTKKSMISEGICTIPSKSKKPISNEGEVKGTSIDNENLSNKSLKPISCFLCLLRFATVSEMQSHYLDRHKQKKRSATTIDTVNRSTSVTTKYKPIKSKDAFNSIGNDAGEGEPKCPICSIDFKTEEEVKEHMTSVHCYKCSECQNIFYTLFQFTDHRCNQGNKLKKSRLKKRKVKVKVKSPEHRDKDPLSLSPKLSTVAKPVRPRPTPTIANHNLSSIIIPTNRQAHVQVGSFSNSSSVKCNLSADNISNFHNVTTNLVNKNNSASDDSLQSSLSKFSSKSKSLLDYSLEELTSKEFNKMKLTEIMQNPNLSIKLMKKTESPQNVKGEFFSCGRCNVLCDDKYDFTDHLEECLRLSNVSLISSQAPPKRMIKLKSETISKKLCNYTKTSVNQKLLTQLKNYIDSNNTDLFQISENINNCLAISDDKQNENKKRHGEYFHPDIKGNISIRKIDKNGTKTNLSKSVCSGNVNYKRPMVVIPIDKSFEADISKPMPLTNVDETSYLTMQRYPDTKVEDHYPEISIIDKSNCVTYKFSGSGTDPELKYEPNLQASECSFFLKKEVDCSANNVVNFSDMTSSLEKCLPCASLSHSHKMDKEAAIEIKDMLVKHSVLLKTEPSTSLQPHIKVICNSDSDEYEPIEEKYSSLELVLDEEEIKMEVEDEVVDDCF